MNPIFHSRPFGLSPAELAELLGKNPGFLGKGWKLLGRGGPLGEVEADLLLASPEGDLVLCLVGREVDGALLSKGLSLLGAAREGLAFLRNFRIQGWPRLERARLLLVGGVVEKQVLSAAGGEISVLLVSQVEGQPGPPLVVYDPPVKDQGAKGEETSGESRLKPREAEEGAPPGDEPPLEDEEVARLIS